MSKQNKQANKCVKKNHVKQRSVWPIVKSSRSKVPLCIGRTVVSASAYDPRALFMSWVAHRFNCWKNEWLFGVFFSLVHYLF